MHPPAILIVLLALIGLLTAVIHGFQVLTGGQWTRGRVFRRSTMQGWSPTRVRLYSGGWLLFVVGMLSLGAGSAEPLPRLLGAAGGLISVIGMVLVLLSLRQPDHPSDLSN